MGVDSAEDLAYIREFRHRLAVNDDSPRGPG